MARSNVFRGDRLKALRQSKQLSRRAVQEATGIYPTQLAAYERNQKEPALKSIKTLSEYFGVTADFLMGLTDSPKELFQETPLTPVEKDLLDAYHRHDYTKIIQIGEVL